MITEAEVDIAAFKKRIRKMSDAQLLRFGRAARDMCDSKQSANGKAEAVHELQLVELRQEYRRRFPKKHVKVIKAKITSEIKAGQR
ncbi:MAG TPA: hypothetical protein VNO32_24505 [Candidatus Acidoferrum sp.]|jgi:hypothetical protein|nr:hypothetical protein [Candidatus Acidoferrum sp.]